MNLTQIGVRSLEKKAHPSIELTPPIEISPLQPFGSSALQLKANALNLPSSSLSFSGTSSNSSSASATTPTSHFNLGSSASSGLRDSKKNSWQTRGISLPSTGPDSVPTQVTKSPSSSLDRTSSSWVGVRSSIGLGLGQGQDNFSDDGVGGVSNSEVEDEWLEVKQRKPKGAFSNASSNVSSGKGGVQSNTSTSTLKVVRSRSTSPAATSTPISSGSSSSNNSNISESFAAILSKKEDIQESVISLAPVMSSTSGYSSSAGPSVQIPIVSTMGFRAAVMNGQNDTSSISSSFAQTLISTSSQSGVMSMQQPQSFSSTDFPAMPTSSSSAPKTSAANMPSIASAPTAASVVALGATTASVAGAAAVTLSLATTVYLSAADANDKSAALIGSVITVKKPSKIKKKAFKNGIEVISEKESVINNGIGAIATTVADSIGTAECVGLAVASVDAVGFDIKNGNGNAFIEPSLPLPIPLLTPVISNLPDKREYGTGILEGMELCKDPRFYKMPVLTAQGSYAAHITQSSYDMHTVGHNQINEENCTSSCQLLPQAEISTIHINNMHQQIHKNSRDGCNANYQYSYQQRPTGDEEDDDDLFKAISSAHAIDFDPSFTANSLNLSNTRPISCTLSPLSRRIGSRPERDHDVGIGLPLKHSTTLNNLGMSPYESSSLLDSTGESPPMGPLCGGSSSHTNKEGFLSGISFNFFSSLLHPSEADGVSSGILMRKEGSLEILPHANSTDLTPSNQTPHRYAIEQPSLLAMDTMKLNDLQSGLSPLCQEYHYTGSLPEITENDASSIYQETDAHKIRLQMPALTPILPTTSMPPLQPSYITNGSMDLHNTTHSSAQISHYPNGILDLSQNLQRSYVSLPVLLTAKELSLATDNFSTANLIELMETKQLRSPINKSILKTNRAKMISDKEKEKEREREASVCTFFGTIRSNNVIMKIITQNNDTDINNSLQSQFLMDLRVLSEVSHSNILPLLGYTFRPCARVFRIPIGTMNMSFDNSTYNNNVDSNCNSNNGNGSNSCYNDTNVTYDNNNNNHIARSNIRQSRSVGYYTLGNLLQDNERRKLFPWKFRIRIIICILRALGYLHLGDSETGRCPIAHW